MARHISSRRQVLPPRVEEQHLVRVRLVDSGEDHGRGENPNPDGWTVGSRQPIVPP
jgi:hypothetical protein